MTFSEINDATGFANGDEFTSEQQVRDYFKVANMSEMFGLEQRMTDQGDLDAMPEAVITNRWHCAF